MSRKEARRRTPAGAARGGGGGGSMTTTHLRNFVESVAELPAELQRCFRLMRELDDKAVGLRASADAAARRRLEELAAAKQVR